MTGFILLREGGREGIIFLIYLHLRNTHYFPSLYSINLYIIDQYCFYFKLNLGINIIEGGKASYYYIIGGMRALGF